MHFLSMKIYSKILRIKIKSVYVKDFLISTKVRLKKVEHLHSEEIFSCELYFSSSDAGYLRNASTDCLNNLIKNLANSLTTTLSVTLFGVAYSSRI